MEKKLSNSRKLVVIKVITLMAYLAIAFPSDNIVIQMIYVLPYFSIYVIGGLLSGEFPFSVVFPFYFVIGIIGFLVSIINKRFDKVLAPISAMLLVAPIIDYIFYAVNSNHSGGH
jgi:hypothetical protein